MLTHARRNGTIRAARLGRLDMARCDLANGAVAQTKRLSPTPSNALRKDIIDLLNRGTVTTRVAVVALADAAGLVIKQSFKPEHYDETVEYLASLVKSRIRELSSQSEEND
jgi:hypothetical protein